MRAFFKLFQAFILRNLLKNRFRTSITILGIALGVAITLAINLANRTALDHFTRSISMVSGRSNLEAVSETSPDFNERILKQFRFLWEENISFTPVLEVTGIVPGPQAEVIQILGMDMLQDTGFRTYQWVPDGQPESFLTIFDRRQAYLTQSLAQAFNLKRGDSLTLLINDQQRSITVNGILQDEGLGAAYGSRLVLMDIGSLQDLAALSGRISRVEMVVPANKLEDIQEALRKRLSGGLTVQRPAQRGQQVDKMLRAFQDNLRALSFIALLVGMFLIYNTMLISVLRRRTEIATLRALGLTRKAVFGLFLSESILLGGLGSLLGIGLGIIFAHFTLSAVSQTVQTLYTGQPVTTLSVNPREVLIYGFLGLLLTVLAAIQPVIEAATIPPAIGTRHGSYESRVFRYAGRLAAVGAVLALLALVAALQPPVFDFPLFGYASAFFSFLSGALFLPFMLSLLLPGLARGIRFFGVEGKIAVAALNGSLGKTAVSVASLMIGIAMMVSLAIMISSFRQTVIAWVNQTLRADLFIEPAARTVSKRAGSLDPALVARIRQIPGVDAVDGFIEFPITYQGRPTNLGSGDFETLARRGNLRFLSNEPAPAVLNRTIKAQGVIVSEPFALKSHVDTGKRIRLRTPGGLLDAPVEGVYYDYASDNGYIILPKRMFRKYYTDRRLTSIAVYTRPGASAETIRRRILQVAGPGSALSIRTNRELRAEVLRIFDDTFAITYALHTIAIAVALFSILNTLLTLVMESRREFGILKHLGTTTGQIQAMVLTQAAALGVLGNLTGMLLGTVLSILLIEVINKQSFGWTIQFHWPWGFLVQSFILVLLTAILAGLWPARLAARTLPQEVLRDE